MQTTGNTQAFIDAEVYSQFILENLNDGLLPEGFYRSVTDFPNGTTLNIKSVGTVTIQDVEENTAVSYQPIDTNTITMHITEADGDAWYVTDNLREDGSQIDSLMAARAAESTRALQEVFESKAFLAMASGHTNAAPNQVNGFSHRIVGSGTGNIITIDDFIKAKLAFDKANVPQGGRLMIIDPVVEASLNKLVQFTSDITPYAAALFEQGWGRDHRLMYNIMGFDIVTSNRLPKGTFSDGTTSVTDGVTNLFTSIADDNSKVLMQAWRRMPSVKGEYNKDYRRDEFVTSCRYGFGVQRVDTLGTLITSAVNY